MKRRDALAALGSVTTAGFAGCLVGVDPPASRGTTDSEPTSTESTTSSLPATEVAGDLQRRVGLAGQDAVPDEYGVRIEAEVLRGLVTDEETARVRITTTNEGPERRLSVGPDMCNILNRNRGASDDPRGLWLHEADSTEYIERDGDRWVAERADDEPRGYPAYGCGLREYDAGESVNTEYVLWDDYRVEGYLEPGTYRWEETVRVSTNATTGTGEDSGESFAWGFSLRVEKPNP